MYVFAVICFILFLRQNTSLKFGFTNISGNIWYGVLWKIDRGSFLNDVVPIEIKPVSTCIILQKSFSYFSSSELAPPTLFLCVENSWSSQGCWEVSTWRETLPRIWSTSTVKNYWAVKIVPSESITFFSISLGNLSWVCLRSCFSAADKKKVLALLSFSAVLVTQAPMSCSSGWWDKAVWPWGFFVLLLVMHVGNVQS